VGDTKRFWGASGKSEVDTKRLGVGGSGNIEKVHGDAGIFEGTPGENIGRFGRRGGRSGMGDYGR
jgi:hypothetical protein